MTDEGITLNIYNKPPEFQDNTSDNINQTEAGLNATNNLPTKSVLDQLQPNFTSAPGANFGLQTADNTRENNDESTENNQSSVQQAPMQQYPPPILGYQQTPMNPVRMTPARPPIVQPYNPAYNQPYNPQYAQPVVIRQNVNNQRPKTVVIQEQKEDTTAKDCCTGFLATCGAICAVCCLLSLCSGGGHGRRGRW